MKKLAQKHPFFFSKETFKNSFKHQLQEKFLGGRPEFRITTCDIFNE
jgi:hypothetical protein